jgi:uncharacterized protein
VAGRSGNSGPGKRSKQGRGPRRDSVPFQRRIDRHHGGPPAHIIARQQSDKAKRLARQAAAAAQTLAAHQTAAAPAMPPLPANATPITAPRPAEPARAPMPVAHAATEGARPSSISAVTSADLRARVAARHTPDTTTAPQRRTSRLALAAIGFPLAIAVGAVSAGLLSQNSASPPPPITRPVVVADTPLRSEAAIRQRILDMTPPLAHQRPEPAWPGSIRFAALSLPTHPPDIAVIVPPRAPLAFDRPLPDLPAPTLTLERPARVDAVAPIEAAVAPPATAPVPAIAPAPVNTAQDRPMDEQVAQCRAPAEQAEPTPVVLNDSTTFGQALAVAAVQQTRQFIVYDARYTRIAYPGGDVAPLHGVCTDVVIRAYRALGIDLQRIVYESRVGIGDTSIDHRRTETLRRFLATHGESLPLTAFAEDYLPGDIVTYYRPQNRISTAHIAIVSDQIGPSGRPMIIHNRGLGVQLEDGLFVDRMTGHYRYLGPRTPLPPLAIAARTRPTSPATAFTTPSGEQAAQRPPTAAVAVIRAAAKSPAAQKLALRFAQQQETVAASPTNRAATRTVDKPRP